MSAHTPKVSIGLPVYNGENYVAQAIESILVQTYGDWELIISDNGSSDRTADICRGYAARDSRLRYHRVEENRGVVWNFNRVFELAQGEYFKWIAHDDLNAPRQLERLVAVLDEQPDVVLASFESAVIDDAGNLIVAENGAIDCALQGVSPVQEERRRANTSSATAWRRYYGVLLNSLRCYEIFGLVRSSVMRQSQLMGPYRGSEKVLLSEIALHGKFHEVPDVLFFNRWHDARFSQHTSARGQQEYFSGKRTKGMALPAQFRCSWGYFSTIFRPRLSLWQRFASFLVFLRFMLQFGKILKVFRMLVHGAGESVSLPSNIRRLNRHPNLPPRLAQPDLQPVEERA